ncbi:TMEM175 family protein [Thermomonospora amylolytica]|uniref:TMEM175 family protein n=1 Tax=Thermomonospora amylolytica TaxID=1411117 RepID=UPI000E6D5A34|nr:TMEM175 family protein [Thermomonospora amylolytica]
MASEEGPERSMIGVERLRGFADAVIAIAITLLALTIEVEPHLSEAELTARLRETAGDVAAYALSFAVIGLFWLGHHGLFSLVARVDGLMVGLELALLAVLALMPFPTRLISEYGDLPIAVAVYAGTIALAGALMTAMAVRLRRPGGLRAPDAPQRRVRQEIVENAALTMVFAATIPIAFVSTTAATALWLLLFLPGVVRGLRPLLGRRGGERF